MPSTHQLNTILAAGTSVVAGTPQVGTGFANTSGYGAWITGIITNGATAPTVQCNAYIEISGDNTNWKQAAVYGGGTVANAVTPFNYNVSPKIMYYRVRFADNTVQSVTAEAFAHALLTV